MAGPGVAPLPAVELTQPAGAEARRSIIWLHGLGADGHDFEPIVPALALPAPTRFVFPHAPLRPVTINGGLRMRAWYDIVSFERSGPEDEAGMRESAAAVGRLVDREIERGIAAADIMLAGFSQGGAIALHAGLREGRRLGGLISLSGYLPLAGKLADERSAANAGQAVFMAHGTLDPVVPVSLGEASRRLLEGLGYRIDWHGYPIGHTVSIEEIGDLGRWIGAQTG